jgi:hypothetical protein
MPPVRSKTSNQLITNFSIHTDLQTKEDQKLFACVVVSVAWQAFIVVLYMVWYIYQRRRAHRNFAADIEVFDEDGRRSSAVVSPTRGAASRTPGGESVTSHTRLGSSVPSVTTSRGSKATLNK